MRHERECYNEDIISSKGWKGMHKSGGDAVYGLGLIGALIYFLIHAQTIGQGLIGVLKALVWPAILIFKLFELLKL